MKIATVATAISLALISGCHSPNAGQVPVREGDKVARGSGTRVNISEALGASPTVRAYARSIHGTYSYMIDDETPLFTEVAVGEDMPDHFVRGLTLRVYKTGEVYVQDEDALGNETWRLDCKMPMRPFPSSAAAGG